MIEDLTMLATLPVCEDEVAAKTQADADKAAAGETMPAPKEKRPPAQDDSEVDRLTRRGQDPPEQEEGGEEDRG